MNDASNKQKDSILKTLAIAGFIGIIILVAWLAIQFVNIMPGAFSSLASLAEGVDQYKQATFEDEERPIDLIVTSNATLINTGDDAQLSWRTVPEDGSYTFSYACTDGVAVEIQSDEGQQNVSCGENYNIGNTNSLSMTIDSENQRYADLEYTISFLAANDDESRAAGSGLITVMNSAVTDTIAEPEAEVTVDTTTDAPPTTDEPETTDSEPTVTPDAPSPDDTSETPPSSETPTTPPPVTEQQYVYQIPTSDPNGRTDLGVRFIAVGTILEERFSPGTLTANNSGAIQFEVKNYGTKTSDEWSFSVELPNGTTYTADEQSPLKPNERAVLTIGFGASDTDTHEFIVIVDAPRDQNNLNDSFREDVDLE